MTIQYVLFKVGNNAQRIKQSLITHLFMRRGLGIEYDGQGKLHVNYARLRERERKTEIGVRGNGNKQGKRKGDGMSSKVFPFCTRKSTD